MHSFLCLSASPFVCFVFWSKSAIKSDGLAGPNDCKSLIDCALQHVTSRQIHSLPKQIVRGQSQPPAEQKWLTANHKTSFTELCRSVHLWESVPNIQSMKGSTKQAEYWFPTVNIPDSCLTQAKRWRTFYITSRINTADHRMYSWRLLSALTLKAEDRIDTISWGHHKLKTAFRIDTTHLWLIQAKRWGRLACWMLVSH